MDKSKIYQTEIPVSSNIGEITINSYTGRLLVKIPDMAVGAASTAMGISHVYNDHMVAGSSDFLVPEAMKEYNVGKHWKLSCQQKVICRSNCKTFRNAPNCSGRCGIFFTITDFLKWKLR